MDDKYYQVLMIGLQGYQLTTEEEHLLSNYSPGGVILFARNIASASQVGELCASVYELCRGQPFIAVDQEGGLVDRLRSLTTASISAEAISLAGPELIREYGRITGEILRLLGINLNFAPVVDLRLSDADNALRRRYWGSNASEVTDRAGEYLAGLNSGGVPGCLKHFPGLGRAQADSHFQLPTVNTPLETLRKNDFKPFVELAHLTPMIMVSHCHYSAIDGEIIIPASFSRRIYRLLRTNIAFEGVTVTDDLDMGAVSLKYSIRERILLPLLAGADMLPFCNQWEGIVASFDHLEEIVRNGDLPEERLSKAADRVIAAKRFIPEMYQIPGNQEEVLQSCDERLAQLKREVESNAESC